MITDRARKEYCETLAEMLDWMDGLPEDTAFHIGNYSANSVVFYLRVIYNILTDDGRELLRLSKQNVELRKICEDKSTTSLPALIKCVKDRIEAAEYRRSRIIHYDPVHMAGIEFVDRELYKLKSTLETLEELKEGDNK